ncbi:uncharacterized protein (TIGR03083 family) [Allocatelliglobosispora scoriae]|uniref:Uncharacterized protein (TIGR03083 family) n=1 Tax=Allocatelliglobosispora scoriae TaxID=643052 RepID=A0A841BT07_9ACTN|nr:maleylpyruvate isomerase family mycothiol-dependent enzyme [Allocatelliglobosispora scoriae]MBB5871354.1 uncharacterized protein (TIGR03083 family) [Allocatelliglobosispora scoriae]
METQSLLACLDADFRRLRELADGDLTAKVPTCPEWTQGDLVDHVAHVYLHKAESMRLGARPRSWPPEPSGEPEAVFLARTYAEMLAQFEQRSPADHAVTWFTPDQTVGFWIRRMAQETVIHRIDAELAAGVESQPVPADLAVDGIDEVLHSFLAFSSTEWAEDYADSQADLDGSVVGLDTGTAAWLVTLGPGAIVVTEAASGDGLAPAAAVVRADPEAMLRWLWRRADDWVVDIDGDRDVVGRLRRLLRVATQ